jgi:GTPase Era involved in 16S rRNA processing
MNTVEQKQPIRVLVFGTTGTGKTSLCNALTNENQKVSSGATGVTLNSYTYNSVPFSEEQQLIITDTVGLNESIRGAISSRDAAKQLIKLLTASTEGYNLLIHVFRIPRITQNEETNYNFFVSVITEFKIPTILVATGCENIDPMSKWKDDNKDIFTQRGLNYKDIICTSFASSDVTTVNEIYVKLKKESSQAVLNAIKDYATKESVKLYTDNQDFIIIFKRAWNWFVEWLNLPNLVDNTVRTLKELLIQIGFQKEDIEEFFKEIKRWN